MGRDQEHSAVWKPWITWGLCWCAFTLALLAWKFAALPVARGRRMTLHPAAAEGRRPLVQVTGGNELVTNGRRYRTLVAWTQAVTLPRGRQAVVIEADPQAKVQAVGRLVQWLRSRGADEVVVRVRVVDDVVTLQRDAAADVGQR